MHWRRALVLLCFLMPLMAAFPVLAQFQILGVRATGDANQSFIAIIKRPPPSGVTGFSSPTPNPDFTEILRRGSSDTEWKGYSLTAGHAVDVTVHRGQLMLLMADGSWRAVYEGGSNSGESLPSQTSAKFVMLAGGGPALLGYVLETGGTGRLVQRDGGEWKDLGAAPEVLKPGVADMAVFADRVFLAASMGNGAVRVWRSAPLAPPATQPLTRPATRAIATRPSMLVPATQPVAWELVGTIAAGEPLAGVRLVPLGNDLTKDIGVWADPGDTDGGVIYRWSNGENWERAFALGPVNGELAASLGKLRFYAKPGASNEPAATRPAVDPKARSADEKFFEYAVTYDGKFVGSPTLLDIGQTAKLVRDLGELIVGMATTGLMVAIILWWRKREHWTAEVVAASQALPLAPVGRRLLAGIIDVLPWLGMLAYLFYRNQIVVEIPPFRTRESVLLLLYAYAAVLTHTTLCEVIFGRTAGMAIAGLRVTNMQGNRATPGQILIRNFCRAIDMVLVAPYLAVFTSPLNQSLGDAAGGTLVLTRDSANMPPSSPVSPPSDGNSPS